MNLEYVNLSIKNKNWKQVSECLIDIFVIKTDTNGKPIAMKFSTQEVDLLIELMKLALKENVDDGTYLLNEISRALRNCSLNLDTRKYLANEEFFSLVVSIIENNSFGCLPNPLFQKYLFQLLLNILTINEEVVQTMCNAIYKCVSTYFLRNSSYLYESSALIYNLTRNNQLTDIKIISRIISLYRNTADTQEFLLFLLEKILGEDYFWDNYDSVEINDRLAILMVLRELLIKGNVQISDACVECLITLFLNSTNTIFQVTGGENPESSYEASTVVEVLSALSSEKKYSKLIQQNKDILITAGILLINLHKLGKISDNCFTPIQKLGEIQSPDKNIRESPFFCFKADLIRLIGNLCWKNKKMQDLARKAELIPVLLDCCNMDAKNPFIIQWVILAVRNLCENNVENQKIISLLRQEGVVSSTLLEEFGLTLHSNGEETIRIVPLNR